MKRSRFLSAFCYCLVNAGYLTVSSTGLHNLTLITSQFQKQFEETVFREIFSNLHIRDNTSIEDGRYYKVRSLLEILNTNFKRFVSANNSSVNEIIIPYYGRHGTKQFIRGKSIQFGFKCWCLCSSDGYLLYAKLYCGKENHLPETGLGQGSDVVLGMTAKCDLTKGFAVEMANFLTTLSPLCKLKDMPMYGVGTIRKNRQQGAPLKKTAAAEKETRVLFDYKSDGNNLLLAWRDNKVVIVDTNYFPLSPLFSTKHWSKAEKKHVDAPMPNPFKEYDAGLESLGLIDQLINLCHLIVCQSVPESGGGLFSLGQ